MSLKRNLFFRAMTITLALALFIPMLAACTDDNNEPSLPANPLTTIPPSSSTPASSNPIRIGIISDYSGPNSKNGWLSDQAIAVMQAYLAETGGILNGRPVEWVRGDSQGTVAGTLAAFTHLALDKSIIAIIGATGPAELAAMSEFSNEYAVPYFNVGADPADLTDYLYTVNTGAPAAERDALIERFVKDYLKPSTIAALVGVESQAREFADPVIDRLTQDSNTRIVYRDYVPQGAIDLRPYLTKISALHPDVLYTYLVSTSQYDLMFKQIIDMGGWGNTKTMAGVGPSASLEVANLPAAEGSYHWSLWAPGLDYPGCKTAEGLWMKVHKIPPAGYNMDSYLAMMTVTQAIDQAGTDDRQAVITYARSGKLSWDGPLGRYVMGTDGMSNMEGIITELQDGQFKPIILP